MKALIAMSGGVDSSVTAQLMKDRGYDCVGATMILLDSCLEKESEGNNINKNIEDAAGVCEKIGIPFELLHYEEEFKKRVIEPFIECYERALTPNPCIECNRCIKFKRLFEDKERLGCDILATGHYARVEYDEARGRYLLKKAKDPDKDQSYVLYTLTNEQLKSIAFPLGEFTKEETRALAQRAGLENAKKSDSQDICFVPEGKYAEFIEKYTGKSYPEGDFIDREKRLLGRHKGYIRYTIGQRKGLGISAEYPLYVNDIDPENNEVTLGKNEELFMKSLIADNINLIAVDRIDKPMRVKAKIRYRQKEQAALVVQIDEDHLKVEFEEPQRAITRGQSLVLYDDDIVLGGGIIVSCQK
ncbi:MAG: tRNA 2-thiouridine(34) synthase MnmA [Lachnospiraceae bacterium]|nr:tRNA 2-thiouridine(34) synthase MnmA [Lachnospiraceae bacterium]